MADDFNSVLYEYETNIEDLKTKVNSSNSQNTAELAKLQSQWNASQVEVDAKDNKLKDWIQLTYDTMIEGKEETNSELAKIKANERNWNVQMVQEREETEKMVQTYLSHLSEESKSNGQKYEQ